MARFDDDKDYWKPNADEGDGAGERKGAAYSIKAKRGGGGEPVAPQSAHHSKPIQSIHGRLASQSTEWHEGSVDDWVGGRLERMAKVKKPGV